MNDSLGFFAPFVNAHVSSQYCFCVTVPVLTRLSSLVADMIALSVVMSVGGCSSPPIAIPLRVGRIDATEGGEFGVPEPETGIEETLRQFEKAGFNQTDAIVGCGI